MKKEHKSRLLKFGFRSIYKHKIFTILMFVLVLISGTAYTLLETSNNSFEKSYNQVFQSGQIHDYVIKENFKASPSSSFEVKGVDNAGNLYEINSANAESNALITPDGKKGSIKVKVSNAQGDYASLNSNLLTKTIWFNNNSSDNDFSPEWSIINEAVKSYRSDITYYAEKNLGDKFTDIIRNNFNNEIFVNNNRSISVSADEKAFNVVQYNSDTHVNKIHIYDGTSRFTTPLNNQQLMDILETKVSDKGWDKNSLTFDSLKGFKVSAKDSTNSSISYTDPSSYQAIISPAYANRNNKRSISPEELSRLFYEQSSSSTGMNFMEKVLSDQNLLKKYEQNLVYVDSVPYFIIGIGTTPDYLYPIVDNEHPVVDVSNQAIVYVNNRGYERIYDSFRTNPKEEYISLKFKLGVSSSRQTEILNTISQLAKTGTATIGGNVVTSPKTGYPDNIRMITSARDKNDQMLLTQERIVFLEDLQNTIHTISIATTSLLVIFMAAIIMIVFQMIIGIDRKQLATQLALGYSKNKIALAKALSGLAISILPFIIGYLVGYGSQFWFIQQFDNYWTVPTFGTSFSWLSLVIIVAVPFIAISGIIYLITLWTLRKPITDMLSSGGIEGSDLLAKIIAKFHILGVKGKYAVALTAKNILKLLLVASASTISITALIIGISSIGKADAAYNDTVAMNKYEFEVDLYSPTAEGGYYSSVNEEDLSNIYHDPTYKADGSFSGTPEQQAAAHWHIPSTGDAKYGLASAAGNDLAGSASYLKHKLQVKTLLDQHVAGMNPWDIAKRLMPDNQRNKVEETSKYIDDIKRKNNSSNWDALHSVLQETGDNRHIPYVISYGDVIQNKRDERYTYLSVSNSDNHYKIIGVREDTRMININNDISKLKNFSSSKTHIPILINHYISEKYNLKKGSIWNLKLHNSFLRNQRNFVEPNIKAEVVGVVDGYDNNGIYTLQSIANNSLEMTDPKAFNGVFSQEKNPAILSTMPLYSPSGLWLGTDTIVGGWESVLSQMLADPTVWRHNNVATTTAEFISKYSRTPFVGATSAVLWNEMNKYTFKNISELSSFIIVFIEAIAITLSIIFTIVMASLLLMSNRKKIATLWTMGYRKREIGRIFLSTYIFPMTIAVSVSIALGTSLLFALRRFIMGFGNILIPFELVWWAPIVAIVVVGLIFVVSTLLTIYNQKQEKALEAFKGD